MKHLEPKYSTLIQAAVIAIVMVFVSFVFQGQETATAQLRTAVGITR